MVTFTKELQLEMASGSIWITEFGMVKFTKELQFANASFPMYVTESESYSKFAQGAATLKGALSNVCH